MSQDLSGGTLQGMGILGVITGLGAIPYLQWDVTFAILWLSGWLFWGGSRIDTIVSAHQKEVAKLRDQIPGYNTVTARLLLDRELDSVAHQYNCGELNDEEFAAEALELLSARARA